MENNFIIETFCSKCNSDQNTLIEWVMYDASDPYYGHYVLICQKCKNIEVIKDGEGYED